jgi:hypothetical protein
MLQMLNVDQKKGGQTMYNPNHEQGGATDGEGGSGDEEFRSSATNIGRKNLLPHLKGSGPQQNLNNSVDDNIKIDDENIGIMEENKNDYNRPKMYLFFYYLFLFIFLV